MNYRRAKQKSFFLKIDHNVLGFGFSISYIYSNISKVGNIRIAERLLLPNLGCLRNVPEILALRLKPLNLSPPNLEDTACRVAANFLFGSLVPKTQNWLT
jgi:hypothetical protein